LKRKRTVTRLEDGDPVIAEWVLEDYLRWIKTDIQAIPVDPGKLNQLPSP
jgi:hypothetical protein